MMSAVYLALLSFLAAESQMGWSKPAVVRHGTQPVVRFQALLVGDHVLVRAVHVEGWHTYAIDNAQRAEAALQGKKSLGIEQGLSLEVETGLELDGAWLQTQPRDFSQPELRWFTYGFEGTAFFACRAKQTGESVRLRIRGQACSGETCSQIDVRLEIESQADMPAPKSADRPPADFLKGLVTVRPGAEKPRSPKAE